MKRPDLAELQAAVAYAIMVLDALKPGPNRFHCTHCGKWSPAIRLKCNPPDNSTEVYRWFCGLGCLTRWETNQPKLFACGKHTSSK